MDKSLKPSKEKRRNLEKRKEKSRDAARCRRSRETEIFSDLANGLPLKQSIITQLNKASVMRLVISYLKIQNLVSKIPSKTSSDREYDALFLKALEGFVVILSADGDLVYLSENVNEYLGISQVDMMGNSIYEFSHPCDHEEIREVLSIKSSVETGIPRSFFVRLKCTLTSKGRNVNLKSATYKVIHCSGNIYSKSPLKSEKQFPKIDADIASSSSQHYLIAIGEPIPHPSNIEIPLDKQTFLSKHSLDMKFTYADDKMVEFLGYDPDDLIGKSVFDFYHAMDSDAVDRGFKTLFSKGQCETGKYRFLAKGGGYVWVLTQATVIYGNKGVNPNSVVCVNFVISGIENKNEVYSCTQLVRARGFGKKPTLEDKSEKQVKVEVETVPKFVTAKIFGTSIKKEATPQTRPASATSKIFPSLPKAVKQDEIPSIVEIQPLPVNLTPTNSFFPVSPNTLSPVPESEKPATRTLRPQLATSKIFAPRTEDMNKGFLMFSDDQPGLTILKDEPEDLTHLAPTAGDVCVPLDLPQLSDMFDDFLNENYCPLLNTDDLNSLSDSQSSCTSKTSGDPFFSYRDDSSSAESATELKGRMQSPCFTKSPGGCSIPSLCSPEQSPIMTDDDHMGNFMSLNLDSGSSDLDEDLCLKASFIPDIHNGKFSKKNFPLLMSTTDLMWSSPQDKLSTASKDEIDSWPPPNNGKNESNLAELLLSDPLAFERVSQNRIKGCEQEREVVHLSEVLKLSYSRRNDLGVGPTVLTPTFNNEKLLREKNHAQSLPCIGPQNNDRAAKRAHSGLPEKIAKPKRTKNEKSESVDRIPSELLQHLISLPRPRTRGREGREESVWIADGGGGSESESPPPKYLQSHSVLMNLLEKIPKENLPTVASILRQLTVTSNSRDRVAEEYNEETVDEDDMVRSKERQRFRTNSCSLLSPEGDAIPSLIELSQQDYDVNAPYGLDSSLLQGQDLLNALDIDGMAMSP